ncbi:hypothetical protein [Bradyrhizobium neotropicale]|uniref:hypothetical protein n=1 Tax=Bradyrhizobium neotropicale TaxID=1497615 RepID=UPI001AD7C36D|nr:hypothetical protein [Bradyrhizobium neotropicale]MBO4225108.1 hypothetical protein [Bradyrhizobium neotropicale]
MAKRIKESETVVIAALQRVTELLSSTSSELQQFISSHAATGGTPAAVNAEVNSWDDPFTEAVSTANPAIAVPQPVALPKNQFMTLRTNISDPQPPAGRYNPGTQEFRYWVAAEALARGINFWGSLLPSGTTWSTSNPMQVTLIEAGTQLNANYTRLFGLRFYRQKVLNFDICSCESPDIVRHELGHAILDALRPQLFNVANTETAAFHEAFGDISAILCALQTPATRKTVLSETGGRLNTNSRLSRLAEQLGWGLRQISSGGAERDCLRNAANHFFYKRPDLLPPSADADLLSREEHSFSRVFTGAFLDALARMFSANYSQDEAGLETVSRDIGRLLIDAIHGAPITATYFSQVAAAMIQADQARFGGRNNAELTGAFLEHGILSVGSSLQMSAAPIPTAVVAAQGIAPMAGAAGAAIIYSYDDRQGDDAHLLGLGQTPELPVRPLTIADGLTLNVHAPEELPRFAVASASLTSVMDDTVSEDTAMRAFVEGLIQRQQVDLGRETKSITGAGKKSAGRMTHTLEIEDGKPVLKRGYFSCGCSASSNSIRMSCT